MFSILTKEERNNGRQYNLDLVKALSIIEMVLCHAVMQFSAHMEEYANDYAYIFVATILGIYVVSAHAFVFCMGTGIVYSRNNTPKYLLIRGIKLYLLGYLLNFLRYSLYILGFALIEGELNSKFWYSLYTQDILQFAGIAMALTALFKWLKLNPLWILLCSLIMSVIGSMIAFTSTGIVAVDLLLGNFFVTTPTESCFTLFNWYIFVALGMLFGEMIRRTPNLDKFYKYTILISGIIMTIYIMFTCKYGFYFLTKQNYYYAISTLEVFGVLAIDLFAASIFYFVLKVVKKERLTVFFNMSKNLTAIYVIQWCILGFIDCVICYGLGIIFPYWLSYLLGFVILVISYKLSVLLKRKKRRE